MTWMYEEAKNAMLPADGYQGGLILDEMTVQEDLQMVTSGGTTHIVGFVDNGKEANTLNQLRKSSTDREVASKVQQFIFLGYTGFRFPVGHFPTRGATAHDMYIQYWECVEQLLSFGFQVHYTNLDGACINRQFMKLHFPDEQMLSNNFVTRNYIVPEMPMIFIMDYSHVAKKIRNSILSSESGSKVRELMLEGKAIFWSMWEEAWQWDRQNPIQIHRKLSRSHIQLDDSSKVRNHLAEEVLDCNMLQLMLDYKESKGSNGEYLCGAIALLEQTSILVRIFRDHRPLVTLTDPRIAQLKEVSDWFQSWETSIIEDTELPHPQHCLLTRETRQDIQSCILGFLELVKYRIASSPGSGIVPMRLNSDVVENFFCQQRSTYNGATTNPTYRSYQTATNSIILEQPIILEK